MEFSSAIESDFRGKMRKSDAKRFGKIEILIEWKITENEID